MITGGERVGGGIWCDFNTAIVVISVVTIAILPMLGHLILMHTCLCCCFHTYRTGINSDVVDCMETFSGIVFADDEDPWYFVSSSSPLLPIFLLHSCCCYTSLAS